MYGRIVSPIILVASAGSIGPMPPLAALNEAAVFRPIAEKSVQIVGDSLIEAVKLTAFVSKRTTSTASQSFFTSMEQALARLAVRKHTTALYLEMTD